MERYLRLAQPSFIRVLWLTLRFAETTPRGQTDLTVMGPQTAQCFVLCATLDLGVAYQDKWTILCKNSFQRPTGGRHGVSRQSIPVTTVPHLDGCFHIYGDCKVHLREGSHSLNLGRLCWAFPGHNTLRNKGRRVSEELFPLLSPTSFNWKPFPDWNHF